jgi:hypothetical protein
MHVCQGFPRKRCCAFCIGFCTTRLMSAAMHVQALHGTKLGWLLTFKLKGCCQLVLKDARP